MIPSGRLDEAMADSHREERSKGDAACPSFLETDCDDGIAAVHVEVRSEPCSRHPESDTDQ